MRSKFFMLAAAAMLAATMPAQAALTLEFWTGNQSMTPFNPGSPSPTAPASIAGLRNWNFTGQTQIGGGGLNLTDSTSQYIVKLVLRDTDTVGDGSGYTLSGDGSFNNAFGLATFAIRFNILGTGITGNPDPVTENGQAQTVTVWNGANSAVASTNENAAFANGNAPVTPTSFTVGNIFGAPSNQNGVSPFQVDANNVIYPLANLLLNVAPGSGTLQMVKPNTPAPTFGSIDGLNTVPYDTAVWGAAGTNVYSVPFTVVPEPSSMVLAGLAVSSLGYKLRRKFTAKKA